MWGSYSHGKRTKPPHLGPNAKPPHLLGPGPAAKPPHLWLGEINFPRRCWHFHGNARISGRPPNPDRRPETKMPATHHRKFQGRVVGISMEMPATRPVNTKPTQLDLENFKAELWGFALNAGICWHFHGNARISPLKISRLSCGGFEIPRI